MDFEALKTVFTVLGGTVLVMLFALFVVLGSVAIFGPTIWALLFGGTLEFIAIGIFIYWMETH